RGENRRVEEFHKKGGGDQQREAGHRCAPPPAVSTRGARNIACEPGFVAGRPKRSVISRSEGIMTYQKQQDAIKNKMAGTASDVADRASSVMESAKNQGAAAKKEVYRTASDIANRATDALNDAGIDTDSLSRAL